MKENKLGKSVISNENLLNYQYIKDDKKVQDKVK